MKSLYPLAAKHMKAAGSKKKKKNLKKSFISSTHLPEMNAAVKAHSMAAKHKLKKHGKI